MASSGGREAVGSRRPSRLDPDLPSFLGLRGPVLSPPVRAVGTCRERQESGPLHKAPLSIQEMAWVELAGCLPLRLVQEHRAQQGDHRRALWAGSRWTGPAPLPTGVCTEGDGPPRRPAWSSRFPAGLTLTQSRKEEGRKGAGGPCPPIRVREGHAHLGEQVAAQLGVSHRAPRHMGQEGDEPLDLVQHSIGIGQGPLVLQPGEPPGPQHTVQLCLHPACG